MVRSLPVFALVAVAAPSASAQHVVYSAPVVSHRPVYTYTQPVVQSGRWFNRPVFGVPASSHPISRPFYLRGTGYDPDRVFGGSPFQSRPLLNIAVGLALR